MQTMGSHHRLDRQDRYCCRRVKYACPPPGKPCNDDQLEPDHKVVAHTMAGLIQVTLLGHATL